MRLDLLTKEEREAVERRAYLAFARGISECESDFTWADPNRPPDGSMTALDDAYDAGRAWGIANLLGE